VIARLEPPAPRSSAVVDPRIGDLGPALLALEDGSIFPGVAFGAPVSAGGDLVVNTSQTGYQEVCTDPSYAGQVVVMTYPLIGNYGRLAADDQSVRPWLRALVTAPGETDLRTAREAAATVPRWEDQDFVGQVSPSSIMDVGRPEEGGPLIAIVDYGLKSNIILAMRRRGARVRILPHTISSAVALAPDIDGVILSPGPGDPARLGGPVALAKAVIEDGRPLLGICLGHQIVARAAGAETTRLRFGHHGANHPVRDVDHGLVQVTAQNHEVQVVGESLPAASGFRVSQVNLNDGSVEGLRHRELPIETVQYHPEGAPGPLDALAVFDRFVAAAGGTPA
jgi:carbamoyl-phosphate synthase small subunit